MHEITYADRGNKISILSRSRIWTVRSFLVFSQFSSLFSQSRKERVERREISGTIVSASVHALVPASPLSNATIHILCVISGKEGTSAPAESERTIDLFRFLPAKLEAKMFRLNN